MAKNATKYEAGTYVVTVDRLRQEVFADDDKVRKEPVDEAIYEKGEEVELDEREATRHANAGAIAAPDSLQARVAKGEVPSQFVPSPGLTDEQLRVQLEAIQQVLREREERQSYDRTAEGGVDPTDPDALKSAREQRQQQRAASNATNTGDGGGEKTGENTPKASKTAK